MCWPIWINISVTQQYGMREVYLHWFGRKPEVQMCRKWFCMICLIDMSGTLFGWMRKWCRRLERPFFSYAIPAWCVFLTVEQVGQINAFLKRCYKYGFCTKLYMVEKLPMMRITNCLLRCKRHSIAYMKSFLRLKPAPFTYVTKAT